jgi:hypothetical protein
MTKTVTLTLEQAEIALQCIKEMVAVTQNATLGGEVSNTAEIALYLSRAELAQRLNTAINNAMKETK